MKRNIIPFLGTIILIFVIALLVFKLQRKNTWEPATISVVYIDGTTETYKTQIWWSSLSTGLKAGCTTDLLDNRCGVRSAKIIERAE